MEWQEFVAESRVGYMRTISEKELVHERLGARFAEHLSEYDTSRRVAVLVDKFLGDLRGQKVLDVGCGLGFFSRALHERGGTVTATDIGQKLLDHVRRTVGCECVRVDALNLVEHFGPAVFDVVLSSECIEHTPSPARALQEMTRVLKPGGLLAVSTPNQVWYPLVRFATLMKMRPFDGLENFSTFGSIRRILGAEGVHVLREEGLHLIPFQFKLYRLSSWCDDHLQQLRSLMINLCVLAKKT